MSLLSILFGRPAAQTDPVAQAAACANLDEMHGFLNHWSGYAREAAIGRVVSLRGEGAVAAVLPRLNDHVPQVREAARRAIQTLLPFAGHNDLLACLGFTWRLRQFSRTDHSGWISSAQRELAVLLSIEQLFEALESSDPLIARGSFHMMLELELVPPAELLVRTIACRNDIVIARLAAQLTMDLPEAERSFVAHAGIRSRFGVVRTLALRALLGCSPNADTIAFAALLETQGSARSYAQYFLRLRGVDIAGFYRTVLEDETAKTSAICIALTSLGNVGTVGDVSLMRTFTRAKASSIRGAAYLAWLKLVPSEKDEIAHAALSDESRANRKIAASIAVRHGAYVPFERVREILQNRPDASVLLSFARLRKWDWIETLAHLGKEASQESPEWDDLSEELARWLAHAGQSYELPAPAQRARILDREAIAVLEKLCRRSRDVLHYELGLISQ